MALSCCTEGKTALAADLPNKTLPGTPLSLMSLGCALEIASQDEIQAIMMALVSSAQQGRGAALSALACCVSVAQKLSPSVSVSPSVKQIHSGQCGFKDERDVEGKRWIFTSGSVLFLSCWLAW